MTGQYGHFNVCAPEQIAYAIERYTNEAQRLLGVLDKRLEKREFVCGNDYTIADMACYPWISPYSKALIDLSPFPQIQRWQAAIGARSATTRAYAQGDFRTGSTQMSEETRKILFGQGPKRP
jgi:GST-like protein